MDESIRIVTRDTTRAEVAEKLGFNQPSALDLVSRSKYDSDDAYLDAVVKAEMERSDPKYQELRRKYAMEYRQRKEEEDRKAHAARYAEIRSGVQLWDHDIRGVEEQATEMAHRDLAAGRIFASDLGKKIKEYSDSLTEKSKDTKAQNQLMTEIIRGMVRG